MKTNWDTQEAFNLLSNDAEVFNNISLHAELDTLNVFMLRAMQSMLTWYNMHGIDEDLRISFALVNWEELRDRFLELKRGES